MSVPLLGQLPLIVKIEFDPDRLYKKKRFLAAVPQLQKESMMPPLLLILGDLEDIKIDEILNIKISYNDMIYTDTGKRVKGNWEPFEFTANGENLMAETRTILINKKLAFPDGQEIMVKDMVISPFSTMLNYSCENGKDRILFAIEDQDGYRQEPNRAKMLSANSCNRFDQKSLANATRVTITPMRLIRKTGTFEAYPDKAFEVIPECPGSNDY